MARRMKQKRFIVRGSAAIRFERAVAANLKRDHSASYARARATFERMNRIIRERNQKEEGG